MLTKMNQFFREKTTVRREKDPPWVNPQVMALKRKRQRIYHGEGRLVMWKSLMKKVRNLVRKRAGRYWEHQKRNLSAPD